MHASRLSLLVVSVVAVVYNREDTPICCFALLLLPGCLRSQGFKKFLSARQFRFYSHFLFILGHIETFGRSGPCLPRRLHI